MMQELKIASTLIPSFRKLDDALLLSLKGEIDLHNSPEVRNVVLALLAEHQPKRLILNLEQVPYMDSSAIAVLVEALQKMRKAGGRVYLTNLQPRVKGLLEIARLDSIFIIAPTEQDALKNNAP
jgi:anti-sigma B factor antagonist